MSEANKKAEPAPVESMVIGPFECYESNLEVRTELYDEFGNALTYGQILDQLNGLPSTDPTRAVLKEWQGEQPTLGKHQAKHPTILRETVKRLESSGDNDAASVVRWLVWWNQLTSQRAERFAKELCDR